MGLSDDVKNIKKDVSNLKIKEADRQLKELEKKKFKIPFKYRSGVKKKLKDGKILGIICKSNKSIELKYLPIEGGLIQINEYQFKAFEREAVYVYNNKIPAVVVYEDRLTPVGGITEEYKGMLLQGSEDKELSKKLIGINDFAQQTIIRAIEKIELDKELGKKKKSLNIVWIIIGIVVVIYLISQGGFLG